MATMKKTLITLVALVGMVVPAAAGGMLKMASPYDAKTTLDRLETVMKEKGITIFARIDHAAGAASVGETLPPTELMLFGNPKLGTPLMLINREAGFDLPMKAMAWEDADGKVWLAITNPAELNQVYALAGADGVIEKMSAAVKALTTKALEN